jgi:hypothetical protein
MKVSELTGAMLDYWVARANASTEAELFPGIAYEPHIWNGKCFTRKDSPYSMFCPSINWAHGGPIIERERIDINTTVYGWEAYCDINQKVEGKTALEAAMRAYVASEFGEEVPDEEAA